MKYSGDSYPVLIWEDKVDNESVFYVERWIDGESRDNVGANTYGTDTGRSIELSKSYK